MPTRALAFLLAFVLLWTGISGPQPAHALAAPDRAPLALSLPAEPAACTPTAPADEPPAAAPAESLAAGHAESLADPLALLMDGAPAPATALRMARPHPGAAPTRLAPFLDGLRRPPRPGSHLG